MPCAWPRLSLQPLSRALRVAAAETPRQSPAKGTSRTLAPPGHPLPVGKGATTLGLARGRKTEQTHTSLRWQDTAQHGIGHDARINQGPTLLLDKPAATCQCPSQHLACSGRTESSCGTTLPTARLWTAPAAMTRWPAGTVRQRHTSSQWVATKTNYNKLIRKRALCVVYFV